MSSHNGVTPQDKDRLPIADVLPGLEIHSLPEDGDMAIEAFVLIKLLDDRGARRKG